MIESISIDEVKLPFLRGMRLYLVSLTCKWRWFEFTQSSWVSITDPVALTFAVADEYDRKTTLLKRRYDTNNICVFVRRNHMLRCMSHCHTTFNNENKIVRNYRLIKKATQKAFCFKTSGRETFCSSIIAQIEQKNLFPKAPICR